MNNKLIPYVSHSPGPVLLVRKTEPKDNALNLVTIHLKTMTI